MSNNSSQKSQKINILKVYFAHFYIHYESVEGCGESLLIIATQGPRIMEAQSLLVLLCAGQGTDVSYQVMLNIDANHLYTHLNVQDKPPPTPNFRVCREMPLYHVLRRRKN